MSWARFRIQSRGLPKWEVLQVICFADWGRSLGLGLKRLSWGLEAGLPAGISPLAGPWSSLGRSGKPYGETQNQPSDPRASEKSAGLGPYWSTGAWWHVLRTPALRSQNTPLYLWPLAGQVVWTPVPVCCQAGWGRRDQLCLFQTPTS